jgi:predicted transcriptional regulator
MIGSITEVFFLIMPMTLSANRWDMNELLNVISASDKRRNLLILLNSGPREWDDVKKILNVTSTGMLPQVKILEEEGLIERDGRKFSLTPMGKVLATHMEPLLRTMEVFDKNRKFWLDHNIGVLPHELLLTIADLGNYEIIEVPDEDLFNINPFLANIAQARSIRGITHTVHPKFPEFFTALAKRGVHSSLIFTPNVFKIVSENYADMLSEYLSCSTASLYVSKENLKFSFALTDSYFSISLFYNSGIFDSKHDITSRDATALRWGDQLFTYYRKLSKKVESLH